MMVLQTLRRSPLHGYAIAQQIRQTSDDLLTIEEGTLYPALQRLLREGMGGSRNGAFPLPTARSAITALRPRAENNCSGSFPPSNG